MLAATRKAAPFVLLAIAAVLAGCSAGSASYQGIDLFPQTSAYSDGACCHDDYTDHLGGGHR